jgi:hypothetical protein
VKWHLDRRSTVVLVLWAIFINVVYQYNGFSVIGLVAGILAPVLCIGSINLIVGVAQRRDRRPTGGDRRR